MRLLVFDLDGTLAALGKGIEQENLEKLRLLSRKYRIAICSGKPMYYLCGFMRQVGIDSPILMGENGATIVFGVDLPPKKRYSLNIPQTAKASISAIKEAIIKKVDTDMWFQPNEVCLTPFPRSKDEFDKIDRIIADNPQWFTAVDYYKHVDSFDFIPKGVNKYASLSYVSQLLGLTQNDVIAIGDGVNDYPMFRFAALSLGINIKDASVVSENFSNIGEALDYLLSL